MRVDKDQVTKISAEKFRLLKSEGILQNASFFVNLSALLFAGYLIQQNKIDFSASAIPQNSFTLLITTLLGFDVLTPFVLRTFRKQWEKLEEQSSSDKLTGILNRHSFENILEEETRRAGRYRFPLSLCLLDLDNFRLFNDNFGSRRGDELLRDFSRFLRGNTRASDFLGRFENDTFCAILPHTDLVRSEKFLARVLANAEERIDCSFCAGVTSYQTGESKADFLSRARWALEQAKREGRRNIRCLVSGQDQHAVLSF